MQHTTVVVGSHDLTLDLIADLIRQQFTGHRLISSHVGSLGGIMALLRGEAHLAGIHLLDAATGVYNLPDLERLMQGRHAMLVNLAFRMQGLMVRKGNPEQVQTLTDLARPGVHFINRQRGSGTRVLLDCLLRKQGIDPDQIEGYGREEYTHMGVAVAVSSGNATAGLGIMAAAGALKLDFMPVGEERYDLCIPTEFWDTEEIALVRQVISSSEFLRAADDLPGYDFRNCGQVVGEV
jgi:putative molybdopterin biosynthesis protein